MKSPDAGVFGILISYPYYSAYGMVLTVFLFFALSMFF